MAFGLSAGVLASRASTHHCTPLGLTSRERHGTERFIEEVRGDDPEVAAKLRVEERELEAGGLN